MPTVRQKRAFKEVVKGSSLTGAMKSVGYSLETAKRTNKLTKTKGWKELMDSYLPDKDLAKAHKEGLRATKRSGVGGMKIGIGKNGKVEDFGHTDIEEPDYAVRHKYLETAYKIKNKFPKEGIGVAVQVNIGKAREQYA